MPLSASEPVVQASPAAAVPWPSETVNPARTTPVIRMGSPRSTAARLFLTVWLLYVIHFASNVVRETYLALAIGERFSIRVDDYMGLHPDLFEYPGRGAYINNNPGASFVAALPYALARPFIDGLLRLKPQLAAPKPPAVYDDPRPLRNRFMNEARARGLDIKLGLAAASMHVGLMAPIGAAAAVCVFFFLRARLRDERKALWLAMLYAFGTPIFFRSAFLNQNTLLAHYILFAFVALAGLQPRPPDEGLAPARAMLAGFFIGLGILTDYSAVPLAIVFGLWIVYEASRGVGLGTGVKRLGAFMLGAAGPIALLLLYQWAAFGNPLLPAQAYMPATELSTRGWNGFFWTDPQLLWQNLFEPSFGLIAFCPMLLAACFAPFLRRQAAGPTTSELALIFGASIGLWIFNSSVQFAYLQFNTGVRYMVPAVPLLFFALVPVLLRLPVAVVAALVIPTMMVSWSVAMARESVGTSLARIFLHGFELPWLTVLQKTASGYVPFLADGVSPIPIFCVIAVVLWLVWRRVPT